MRIRSLVIIFHDLSAVAAAWLVACLIMANLQSQSLDVGMFVRTLPIAIAIQGLSFQSFSLHLELWAFIGIRNLKQIIAAVFLGTLSLGVALRILFPSVSIPTGLLLLDAVILVSMLGAVRSCYSAWKNHAGGRSHAGDENPVIVIGAGQAAASLLPDLPKTENGRVVALLDDNLSKRGRTLSGIKIVGPLDEIGQWAKKFKVKRALIAMPSATPKQKRRATELAQAAGLDVFSVPSLADILSGQVSLNSLRRVRLEDLLGRGTMELDSDRLAGLIGGETVLVTGAGGSIGSELCRQIAFFRPKTLVCMDISEFALYTIEQEFSKEFPCIAMVYAVGDVKNCARLEQIMASHTPSLVFHAAAYKHVPMMEQENAWEAVQNNTLGTIRLALAASRHQVRKFVLVSTDKAVNPTNVMGATKRLAELCCKAIQEASATQFVTVRFGNVMGSSGSVIPKFREQIARGGPVTVTHPDIVRYFMLIPEAAQLILQAALMGNGGEIFVLDMGEPVRIVDLARDMIRFSGLSEEMIKIEFTGLRPGEKLFEELLADDEITLPTYHSAIHVSNSKNEHEKVNLNELMLWLDNSVQSEFEVKSALKRWIKEYQPNSANK